MPRAKVEKTVSKTKTVVKTSKKVSKVAEKEVKVVVKKAAGLTVPVYSLTGKSAGSLALPKEVFGVKVNQVLLAQALRVYMNNQLGHHGNTKTRGEVQGSTRKLGSQKGSGHARHGSIMAPIFVGGGIALGPKSRKVRMELPKRMKKASLIAALSAKADAGEVAGVDGLDKTQGKTVEFAKLMKAVDGGSMLIVTDEKKDLVVRGVRNLVGAKVSPVSDLNALEVTKYQTVLVTKEAVARLAIGK